MYSIQMVSEKRFTKYSWYDFYRGAKEAIPPNAPDPRGKPMEIHCFVDASLGGDLSDVGVRQAF